MNRVITRLLPLLLVFGSTVAARTHGNEWRTLNAEIVSLCRQGRYDRAVAVAREALPVAERTNGRDHPVVALSLNNLLRKRHLF